MCTSRLISEVFYLKSRWFLFILVEAFEKCIFHDSILKMLPLQPLHGAFQNVVPYNTLIKPIIRMSLTTFTMKLFKIYSLSNRLLAVSE